jgi:catechol 2,3-dioxygenase-like lactoylglutathione lyase family enzyme
VRLHHVNIVCPPALAAPVIAFYTDVLGLRRTEKPTKGTASGGAWFEIGDGSQLHVSERDTTVSPDQHFGLVVDDFGDLLGRLAASGAPWTEQPDLFGGRRGWTRDPAGNRVEILETAR